MAGKNPLCKLYINDSIYTVVSGGDNNSSYTCLGFPPQPSMAPMLDLILAYEYEKTGKYIKGISYGGGGISGPDGAEEVLPPPV